MVDANVRQQDVDYPNEVVSGRSNVRKVLQDKCLRSYY